MLGELHLPSAFLFDLGVFVVVVGSTMLMLVALAHQSLRAHRQPVEDASAALFGRGELSGLDEPTLAAALRETSVAELAPGGPDGIVDLLVATGLSASKGAAKRTIAEGGVSVNNERVDSEDWVATPSHFLHGRWLVLRRGKRNVAGVQRV